MEFGTTPPREVGRLEIIKENISDFAKKIKADGMKQAAVLLSTAAITTAVTFGIAERADQKSQPIKQHCEEGGCVAASSIQALGKVVVSGNQISAAEAAPTLIEKQEANFRRIKNEPLKYMFEGKVENLPSLERLSGMFPVIYSDWRQQLNHIENVLNGFQVTPGDYAKMNVNRQFAGIFSGNSEAGVKIQPKITVLHWTGIDYPVGLAGGKLFAESLLRKDMSSHYLIPKRAETIFSYFPDDSHKAAGVLGLNDDAINLEIEAQAGIPAPKTIYNITPEQLKATTLMIVKIARRNNLAINEYTVQDHQAVDFIINNPTYNEATGDVATIRKFDFPHELTVGLIKRAQVLDAQLDALKQR